MKMLMSSKLILWQYPREKLFIFTKSLTVSIIVYDADDNYATCTLKKKYHARIGEPSPFNAQLIDLSFSFSDDDKQPSGNIYDYTSIYWYFCEKF